MNLDRVLYVLRTVATLEEAVQTIHEDMASDEERKDERIRRIVREELKKRAKTDRESFVESLRALFREFADDPETSK